MRLRACCCLGACHSASWRTCPNGCISSTAKRSRQPERCCAAAADRRDGVGCASASCGRAMYRLQAKIFSRPDNLKSCCCTCDCLANERFSPRAAPGTASGECTDNEGTVWDLSMLGRVHRVAGTYNAGSGPRFDTFTYVARFGSACADVHALSFVLVIQRLDCSRDCLPACMPACMHACTPA